MAYRYGDKNAFWDNVAAGAGSASNAVQIGRRIENVAIFVTTSGATNITVEAAHSGDITSEGILPEGDGSVWGQLRYLNDTLTLALAGAGNGVMLIPDIPFEFIRLRTSAAVTLTAGWMGQGE